MKFLSLDAFRGMAALLIVLYHSSLYSEKAYVPLIRNSDLFVEFFFILSGFVMAYSYLRKIGSQVGLSRFILLRFGRLYPLHLFMLLLWLPYICVKVYLYTRGIGATNPVEANNIPTFMSNLLLLQSFDGYMPLSWNYPSWSISTEFYTYLFFFAIVSVFYKSFSLKFSFILPMVVVVGAYCLAWLLDGREVVSILKCIGGFFMGILIYLIYEKGKSTRMDGKVATFLEVGLLGFLIFSVSNNSVDSVSTVSIKGENIFYYLSMLSFMSVVFLFVIQDVGYISRLLKNSVFQFIGKRSYSIYMIHAILLAGMDNLLLYVFKFEKVSIDEVKEGIVIHGANYLNLALVLVVILCASVTYKYVEIPWRNRLRKLAVGFE